MRRDNLQQSAANPLQQSRCGMFNSPAGCRKSITRSKLKKYKVSFLKTTQNIHLTTVSIVFYRSFRISS